MSAGDKQKMHDQTGCFDPSTMAEGVSSEKDSFPQTRSSPPPPSLMVAGNTTNSNNNSNLEENFRPSVEELSCHHHNPQHLEDVSTYANGVTVTYIDIPQPQHLGLNMGNSYNSNNNNNMDMVQ